MDLDYDIDSHGITFRVTSAYSPPDEVIDIIDKINRCFSVGCALYGGNNDTNELFFLFAEPITQQRIGQIDGFIS